MKINLLLLTAVIALATTSVASADSSHRYKDHRNPTFGHIEHRDHRIVDRHNQLFSFNLIVPGPSYYRPQHYSNQHNYRNNYKHHNNHYKHNRKHNNRHNHHGFKAYR